jgi:hypothetical protein
VAIKLIRITESPLPTTTAQMEGIDASQLRAWVGAQGKLGGAYLAALPHRGEIARHLIMI